MKNFTTVAQDYNGEFNNSFMQNFESFTLNEEDGSITCKASQEFLESGEDGLVIALLWESCLNMTILCDDQCLSNYDMASFLYDVYVGLVYTIPHSISDKFMEGEEVTIYGRYPTTEDMKDFDDFNMF